jgi:hypothetical protein
VEVQVLSPAQVHTESKVDEVLRLCETGATTSQIARTTGVPRSTVRDWRAGATPRAHAEPSCPACGGATHDFTVLNEDYVYLLGLYLGDGCISSQPKAVYKLRVSLDSKYPGIIELCAAAMRSVVPNKVSRLDCPRNTVVVYAYSKSWPCLFPQHGPGKKHDRKIELTEWQSSLVARFPEALLRGLIHSDGCRFMNTGHGNWRQPRYAFDNLSDDIRQIFIDACIALEIHITRSRNTVYVSRKADVARLDTFIGPKA